MRITCKALSHIPPKWQYSSSQVTQEMRLVLKSLATIKLSLFVTLVLLHPKLLQNKSIIIINFIFLGNLYEIISLFKGKNQ